MVSIFDFPEGAAILADLEKLLENPHALVVSNPRHDLQWTVTAGRLR